MKHEKKNIGPGLKEKIDFYIDGELDNEQVDDLWTELIHNSRALDYLKRSEIDDEEYEERVNSITQTGTKKYWRLTAVLVLIAGTLFIFHASRETTGSVQPITSIALNYYRSADGILNDEPMLRKAIKLAIQGRNEMAVRTIDVEMSRTDNVHRNSLLLIQSGSVLYNAEKYWEALFRFERVTKIPGIDPLVREKAYWYLGNTYFQLGELDAAKAAFRNAYELDGAYHRVAKKYLAALRGK